MWTILFKGINDSGYGTLPSKLGRLINIYCVHTVASLDIKITKVNK